MQVSTLNAERRIPGGRHANERLRRVGKLPAVIYGHGEKPETVAISLHEFELAIEQAAHVIKLRTDGKEEQYLIKDVQYDHLQKTPLHVDLMRVSTTERVRVKVPLELKGVPKGVADAGGVLLHLIADLEVECLLLAIPDKIVQPVVHLGLGDALHVSELELPEGVKALHDPNELVATVKLPRGEEVTAAAAAPVEGAAAEPEVIGRGKQEEEGEEAGA